MKRTVSMISITLGLILIAASMVPACATHSPHVRSNHVAEAAFIAASVLVVTALENRPNHPGAIEQTAVASVPPEVLLADPQRYDAETHDVVPEVQADALADEPVSGPTLP